MRAIATLAGFLLIALLSLAPGPIHDVVVRDWMKFGVLLSPAVLTLSWLSWRRDGGRIRAIALAVLGVYLLHQGEEHWVDITGQAYAFQAYAHAQVNRLLDVPLAADAPLTARMIFAINAGVWLVALQGILSRPGDAFSAMAGVAATLVNGLTHVASAMALGGYNPGLGTALAFFVPLSLWALGWLARSRQATRVDMALALAWAIGLHIVLIGAVVAANVFRLMPEALAMLLILAWMTLPTLAAWPLRRQQAGMPARRPRG